VDAAIAAAAVAIAGNRVTLVCLEEGQQVGLPFFCFRDPVLGRSVLIGAE
jgi:hypothetical protein